MYVHIDADSMLYKAAAVCQKTYYICDNTGIEYDSLQAFVESGGDNYTKDTRLVGDDPMDTAIQVLGGQMRSIYNAIPTLWPGRQYVYKTYLSGKGNFRLALCPLYKANRVQPKPILLADVRSYFINKYAPIMIDGYEADDTCSSAHVQCQRVGVESVLVHIDKDMDTVVGTHYNPDKLTHYTITPEQAAINYYRQVLTGDEADNVIGIKGIGPAKAAKALPADLSKDNLVNKLDEIVKAYYIKAGREVDFFKNKKLLKMVTNLKIDI